jgi:hypothetical protein
MRSEATTVSAYLDSLPGERRRIVDAVREVILANIDADFEEGMQYGMLGYYLPHTRYPAGYHADPAQPLPFASIGSQKRHVGLYLFCVYCSEEENGRFRDEWLASGKPLDMGKSCVRVKRLDDIPLDVLGRVFERMTAARFIESYEAGRRASSSGR